MRTRALTGLLLILLLAGAMMSTACTRDSDSVSTEDSAVSTETETGEMTLDSSAFEDKGQIPVRFARQGVEGGDNVSLPFSWKHPPEATESFALLLYDSHPAAHRWVHWIVVDMPSETTELPEGASGTDMPPGSVEHSNSWGDVGYGGPEPPEGTGGHYYLATLYALDVPELDVAADADLRTFLRAVQGHVLAEAKIEGSLGR